MRLAKIVLTTSVLSLAGGFAIQPAAADPWWRWRPATLTSYRPIRDPAYLYANAHPGEGDGPETIELEEPVRRGDTLMTVLSRTGIEADVVSQVVQTLKGSGTFNPRDLKPGQRIEVQFRQAQDGEPHFHALQIRASAAHAVKVGRDKAGTLAATAVDQPVTPSLGRATGRIDTSLARAATAAGLPSEVLYEMIRAFSYDVDFQRDLQPDDSFDVVYDVQRLPDGQLARVGHVQYAALTLSGRQLRLYRFGAGDDADFYNDKGESVRKALLKTPIDGAKLTSGFGMRNHPLLGFSRFHKGVDFGAPIGTAIGASGDGVVEKAGPFGEYGNYIKIRHTADYETAYAHMNGFAAGIRPGVHVRQGQTIGYVGMTGLATGPHLHYEVIVKGSQIDPQSVKMPSGTKLDGPALKRFRELEAEMEHTLETVHTAPEAVAALGAP